MFVGTPTTQLTPRSTFLSVKLIVAEPAFYGISGFSNMLVRRSVAPILSQMNPGPYPCILVLLNTI